LRARFPQLATHRKAVLRDTPAAECFGGERSSPGPRPGPESPSWAGPGSRGRGPGSVPIPTGPHQTTVGDREHRGASRPPSEATDPLATADSNCAPAMGWPQTQRSAHGGLTDALRGGCRTPEGCQTAPQSCGSCCSRPPTSPVDPVGTGWPTFG